jgi:hypothetical protein
MFGLASSVPGLRMCSSSGKRLAISFFSSVERMSQALGWERIAWWEFRFRGEEH